jgi:hypothetical protein
VSCYLEESETEILSISKAHVQPNVFEQVLQLNLIDLCAANVPKEKRKK